jgi:transposase InsO family protein
VLHKIGFYNEARLHEALGDIPPAEYEDINDKRDNKAIVTSR